MLPSDPNAPRSKGAPRGQGIPEFNEPRPAQGMGHHSPTRAGFPVGFKCHEDVANDPLLCADDFFPARYARYWCLMSRICTQYRSLSATIRTASVGPTVISRIHFCIIGAGPSPARRLGKGPAAKTFKSNRAGADGALGTGRARGCSPTMAISHWSRSDQTKNQHLR